MKVVLETMTMCHCVSFIFVFLGALVIIFGASFKASPMMTFNLGDSFACAQNLANIDVSQDPQIYR